MKTKPKPASQETRVPGEGTQDGWYLLTHRLGGRREYPNRQHSMRHHEDLLPVSPRRPVACLTMTGRICPAAGLHSALRRFLYHGWIRIRANRRYCCIYPPGPGPYIRCLFSGRSSPMLSGIRWMGGVPTCEGNPPRCIFPGVRTIWGPLTPPPAVMYPPASRFGDA